MRVIKNIRVYRVWFQTLESDSAFLDVYSVFAKTQFWENFMFLLSCNLFEVSGKYLRVPFSQLQNENGQKILKLFFSVLENQ